LKTKTPEPFRVGGLDLAAWFAPPEGFGRASFALPSHLVMPAMRGRAKCLLHEARNVTPAGPGCQAAEGAPGSGGKTFRRDSKVTNSRTPQRRACSTVLSYPHPTSAGAWESEEKVTGISAAAICLSSRPSGYGSPTGLRSPADEISTAQPPSFAAAMA